MKINRQVYNLYAGVAMATAVMLLAGLVGVQSAPTLSADVLVAASTRTVSPAPETSARVEAMLTKSGPIHITRMWPRKKDTGTIIHRVNVWWTWNFYTNANADRYHDWAKFKTWVVTYNTDGTRRPCGIADPYDGTSYHLYVKNNSTGRNFSMSGWLPCRGDTTDSFLKGMAHTPRMYWRGHDVTIKVTGEEVWAGPIPNKHWSVSGHIYRNGTG